MSCSRSANALFRSTFLTGDGGEDISCRLESQHLSVTEGFDGSFPAEYVDSFLSDLKCFFIEGLVYPRKHMDNRYI